jgi:hypothetical protein
MKNLRINGRQHFQYVTPWAVICRRQEEDEGGLRPGCGTVGLTQYEYLRQLSNPDATWRCPLCDYEAEWDDDCPATSGSY